VAREAVVELVDGIDGIDGIVFGVDVSGRLT